MDLGSFGFLNEYHGINKREERFFGILEDRTENYPLAEKKVMIQINGFVADINVTRV